MIHKTTSRFWECFDNLPKNIQDSAKENFELLKKNPKHPSLHLKPVGKFWSVRISLNYRSLGFKDGDDIIWVWIGNHDEYEKLLGR